VSGELLEMFDRRVKETLNVECFMIQTENKKFLYFNLKNGLPIVEFEIVGINSYTMSGPQFQISEFYFANKLSG
jgi:hypothetical protein